MHNIILSDAKELGINIISYSSIDEAIIKIKEFI
jgi:hypothetical protein